MLSARAITAPQASDAMSNASIRRNLDNARMVVSPLREVGLSYTLGNSLDGRKAGKIGRSAMQCRRVDRRLFLGAGAATLIGAAGAARAQAQAPQAAAAGAAALKPTARVVDFVAGFDLKGVPARALERARLAVIHTP